MTFQWSSWFIDFVFIHERCASSLDIKNRDVCKRSTCACACMCTCACVYVRACRCVQLIANFLNTAGQHWELSSWNRDFSIFLRHLRLAIHGSSAQCCAHLKHGSGLNARANCPIYARRIIANGNFDYSDCVYCLLSFVVARWLSQYFCIGVDAKRPEQGRKQLLPQFPTKSTLVQFYS